METLTGNVDTDQNILLLLTLTDVRAMCATNKYTHKLCKSKLLSNKYINAKNNAVNHFNGINDKVLVIQSTIPFIYFVNLMKTMGVYPSKFNTIYQNTSQLSIIVKPKTNKKAVVYPVYYYLYNDIQQYYGDKNSIIELLTHIYYDHLYDKIEIH
jgi:hypothetical protein